MDRPCAAVRLEVFCFLRMPVATFEHGLAAFEKLLDYFIQRGHNLIALGHRQCAARTEIVLHVNNYQGFFLVCHVVQIPLASSMRGASLECAGPAALWPAATGRSFIRISAC